MLRINVGEGSFPPENVQCQTGKLVRLLRYFTPGNYSDPVVLFLPSSASSISQTLGDNLMKIFFAVALISAVLIPATKIYAEES
ncbi:MAG: hypothetical protein OSA83_17955, partial [Pseudomonadales bacterium]|nr:hypothetical protein [Pseudomonadales bacterium]